MDSLFLIYALIGTLTAWVLSQIYADLTSPLRDVPGPFLARYTRLWYFWSVWQGDFHHVNIALHKKYAKPGEENALIVRVGPSMYSLAEPAKIVYGIGSKMPKSKWYEGWKHPSPDRWTLFTDQHIKRHADTRRKFQGLYSLSSLVTYEQYVDQCTNLFVERLNERADRETIDLTRWFGFYAFDVIGEITYSKRLGFLDHGTDVAGIMKALDKSMVYSTLIGIYHWFHPLLYKIMERIPGTGAAARNHLMEFVQERMAQREEQRRVWSKEGRGVDMREDAPRDFLDRMIDMREEGRNVTNYHIFMLGLSNIVAGSDTTAVTLSSVFYHLIRFPNALAKLRQELEETERQGKSKNGRLKFKDSQEMPYLQACIKEATRMHPAVGLPLWRVVPEGGAEICGRHFPAGTEVGINAWVAHAQKTIWGDDVDQFRPERWIDVKDTDFLRNMEAYYLPVSLRLVFFPC
jgi:cytochrome P450